jgi:hypothetical protein
MAHFTGLAFHRAALIDLPNQKELTSFAATFMITHQDLFRKYDRVTDEKILDVEALAKVMTAALKENFNSTYYADLIDSQTGYEVTAETQLVSLCIKAECRFSSLVH